MRTLLEGADYFIYYCLNFPPKIYSAVTPNTDGTFSIYLDPKRDYFHRLKDLEHELNHIRNDDFYSDLPISDIESYL